MSAVESAVAIESIEKPSAVPTAAQGVGLIYSLQILSLMRIVDGQVLTRKLLMER